MWNDQEERAKLLEELGKLKRRIKRRPHLASAAQAILFRLRELRQIARSARTMDHEPILPQRYV